MLGDIIWPDSIQKNNLREDPDAAGFIRQLQRVFEVKKKNSLLQSFSDCKQTDRERGDIDLLRLRIMFKGIRLQGVGWSGFIKCKHFQERNSLKSEKSGQWRLRER